MLSSLLCRYQGSSHFGRRLISSSRIAAGGQDGSTVSYLVHSCGLSPEAAIEAPHKVKLRSLEKADSVLALFRRYEFSDTQISDLVRRHPKLLLVANAQKTLLPKLEFLSSIGLSRLDLVKTVSLSNMLLHRSLKNNIIPCYTYLKKLVISDAKVVFIIKHHSWFFWRMPSADVTANIKLVTELGMPSNCIAYLLKFHTRIVTKKHEEFSQIVSNVKGMGFGPRKILFVQAMIIREENSMES